jgi:hypothetical protein
VIAEELNSTKSFSDKAAITEVKFSETNSDRASFEKYEPRHALRRPILARGGAAIARPR